MTDDIRDPKLYETWSTEDLEGHIADLRKVLHQKRGDKPEVNRNFLKSILDPNNPDFLGSGLSLEEWLLAGRMRDFQESFISQDRNEKKRRMNFVVLMGAELVKIRAAQRFATAWGEAAIECVIEGDWAMLQTYAKSFTFEEEGPEAAALYGSLWARMRELCNEAFETRPGAPPPEPTTTRH